MFTVKSDQIIDSIFVQTTQSSSNILPKWILILISTAHTHPAHTEGEEDRFKYISHHTTHTPKTKVAQRLRLLYCDCIASSR
jgi:hypothetical protein